MAGLRYQPSITHGDQEPRLSGSSKIGALVLGEVRGVLLKLYMPLRWAWAERHGLDLAVRSKLRVSWACSNSLSHWQMGKAASVQMACSAAFMRNYKICIRAIADSSGHNAIRI
eukprot:3472416-Ditylum_brightwellii.AAC.1